MSRADVRKRLRQQVHVGFLQDERRQQPQDVRIARITRLDGKAEPTTFVRPWLFAPRKGQAK